MRIVHLRSAVLATLIWLVGSPTNWSMVAFAKAQTAEQPIEAEQPIDEVFSELRTLKPMLPGENYTVRVAEKEETGAEGTFPSTTHRTRD
jgi:hypothetical protein